VARYDRIARIDPPARSDTFPAWLAVRDLQGRERSPELSRRAMARFLALRPARRLLDRGLHAVDSRSLGQQVRDARQDLTRLPDGEGERTALEALLDALAVRDFDTATGAAIDAGRAMEADGATHAAEEFYLTALELARAAGLAGEQVPAMIALGLLYGARGAWTEAREYLEGAVTRAEDQEDLDGLDRSLRGLVRVLAQAGEAGDARAAVAHAGARMDGTHLGHLEGLRAAALCAAELVDGRLESAVESGWRAIGLLQRSSASHGRALLDLGDIFQRLGLDETAHACYVMVGRRDDALAADARTRLARPTPEHARAEISDGTRSIARGVASLERELVASG
jgi:tetratricopeptide (TPR) repeat protein